MKKILAILLALIAVLALMTGCAKETEEAEMVIEEPDWDAILGTETTEEETPAEPEEVDNTLTLLWEGDDALRRDYTLVALADGNTAGADALIHWFMTREGLAVVDGFAREEYGTRLFYISHDITVYNGEIPSATEDTKNIRFVTTETVGSSGLLEFLLPAFEEAYGYAVEVLTTGDVLATAEESGADILFVHDMDTEALAEDFTRIVDGQENVTIPYLYNYYLLCGPASDPAGVLQCEDVASAFTAIAQGRYPFVSRGDSSDVHTLELTFWDEMLAITAEEDSYAGYDWYYSAKGDGLAMAQEKAAYILTDKLSFLEMQ